MRSAQLTKFMDELPRREFDWIEWNCCHFASDWVRFCTGKDLMVDLSSLQSHMGLRQVMNQFGDNLIDAVSQKLGSKPVSVAFARVGDLVYSRAKGDTRFGAIGICNGRSSFFLSSTFGVVTIPTEEAECAWHLV